VRRPIAKTGFGQIIVGTDYRFHANPIPIDRIVSTPGLSDDDRTAILGVTAAKLLSIEARKRNTASTRSAR
jgi:aminocarboxymuconate-semialdehyde decarboxylase